jgi:hypothetical protein
MSKINENEELETTEKVTRKKPIVEEKIIQINDNFRYIIHTDDNLQLQRKRKYDDGSEDFVFYGWYGDMRSLSRRFIEINTIEGTRDDSVIHMEQIAKLYKDSLDLILKHIKDVKE